jgi:CheY-like chemotaxis protein
MDDRVIMVVDDDHAIREALKDLLSLLGFHVVSARDGEDALALLSDGCKPYAILLDLGMPRMDGWRFRNELLSDPRYASLRVIVMTASKNQRAETLGVSDVLTKPIPLQRLVEVLGTPDYES